MDGLHVVAKQQSCSISFLVRWTQNCSCYDELKLFLFSSNSTFFLVASNSKCSTQLCSEFTQSVLLNSAVSLLKVFYSILPLIYSTCSTQLCSEFIRIVLLNSAASLFELFYSTLQRVYSNCSWYFELNSVSESAQLCSESAQLCRESAKLRQRVLLFLHSYGVKSPSGQWVLSLCILHEEFRYFLLCTLFTNVIVSWIKSLHYSVDSGLRITLQLWNTVAHINPVIMHCLTF